VTKFLDRVAMSHRARPFPMQLSGAQQQRVAVARALVGDPAVLLADEPMVNLDSTNGEAVMTLTLRIACRRSTIVMVTHDRRFTRYATRVIDLFDGHVVSEVPAEEAI
jgi:putative ABC transport system ATP-binding protein